VFVIPLREALKECGSRCDCQLLSCENVRLSQVRNAVSLLLLTPRRRRHLIAAWPKSGNQRHAPSLPFCQIAEFKHEAGRNGTCNTSMAAAPMPEQAMLDIVGLSNINPRSVVYGVNAR